jgi:hypothetical protein
MLKRKWKRPKLIILNISNNTNAGGINTADGTAYSPDMGDS